TRPAHDRVAARSLEKPMSVSVALAPMRAQGGERRTTGLDDATVDRMAATHPELREAIDAAVAEHARIAAEFADLLELDESAQIEAGQAGYVNFYSVDAVNPYVALPARGPVVVTLKGAAVHGSGGYGLLGFGHAPRAVFEAMVRPQAMATVMTPNLSQLRLERALRL